MNMREIGRSELAELLELYRHLHDVDDPLPEHRHIAATWQEIHDNPRIRLLGAYSADQLTSSCTITVIPNLTRGCRPYAVIENVVTRPEYRGQGYGSALLTEALAFAWQQSCYKVMLLTGRKEESTLRFYEKAGFNRYDKQAFIAKAPT